MGNDGVHVKQDVRGELSEEYAASGKSFKNMLYKYLLTLQVAWQSNTLGSLMIKPVSYLCTHTPTRTLIHDIVKYILYMHSSMFILKNLEPILSKKVLEASQKRPPNDTFLSQRFLNCLGKETNR